MCWSAVVGTKVCSDRRLALQVKSPFELTANFANVRNGEDKAAKWEMGDLTTMPGWHLVGVCGPFAAAAACALLMGLDTERTAWALGLAGTQSAGLWAFNADGTMSKRLYAGKAAHSGVLTAKLAASGFSGPTLVYETGDGGFLIQEVAYDNERGWAHSLSESSSVEIGNLRKINKRLMNARGYLEWQYACGLSTSIPVNPNYATGNSFSKPQKATWQKISLLSVLTCLKFLMQNFLRDK